MEDNHEYVEQARELIERLDRLDIIYIRVSTKDKGQREEDQLPDIFKTFNLNKKDCLVIAAKESAYQINKQKYRKINIVKDLFVEFEDENKILYVWDNDRLFRNAEIQIDFFRFIDKYNGIVLSHRQKHLHQLKDMGIYGRTMYRFFIDMLAAQAQDESERKADRQKKSRHIENGRLLTNKNNLVGRKLKTTSGKPIKNPEVLDKIENYVAKLITNYTYVETIAKLAKKDVKISVGYITKLKKKRGLK